MQQVLIFDYDGVIVDSLTIFMKYFSEACKQKGYDYLASKQEFLALFNGNMFDQMMKKGMNKKTILDIVYYVKKGLIDHQDEIKLFPNIKPVLEELAIKHKLKISTSNETNVVLEYLKFRNMEQIFDGIYGSDIEPSKVKKIQLIQNQVNSNHLTYIGDTVGDIKEAQIANVTTVAVTWGWHSKNDLLQTQPDHIIHQPIDLISLFNTPSPLEVD